MPERDFDLVLYGATGYTGRRAAAYLAAHAPRGGLRWAVAGRDRGRLEALRRGIGLPIDATAVLVADAGDRAAVDAIARRTRVLLSTAGPFDRLGTPLVDACVRSRTHYADITGETAWARRIIDAYHDRAAADGTRIVPFCGFDSVPSDIGTLLLQRHVRETLGAPCVEVRAYYRFSGGLNGGTAASVVHTIESGRSSSMGDPFLLDPPLPHSERQRERSRDVRAPRFDAELGGWTGPFVVATTNTRVVRRSAALQELWGEPYGPEFVYQEYWRHGAPLAPLRAAAATAGLGLFYAALRWPPTRGVVKRLLPEPGTGPSEASMDRGWFSCSLLGIAADGRRAWARIRHAGDPSNRATVRFACESALALALDGGALPGGPQRGGVLTPATGIGLRLAERLRAAGVAIEVGVGGPGAS